MDAKLACGTRPWTCTLSMRHRMGSVAARLMVSLCKLGMQALIPCSAATYQGAMFPSYLVKADSRASSRSAGALPLWSKAPVRSTPSELSASVLTQCAWPLNTRTSFPSLASHADMLRL